MSFATPSSAVTTKLSPTSSTTVVPARTPGPPGTAPAAAEAPTCGAKTSAPIATIMVQIRRAFIGCASFVSSCRMRVWLYCSHTLVTGNRDVVAQVGPAVVHLVPPST